MKARIPLDKRSKKIIEQEAERILEDQSVRKMRQIYKVICYALNRGFGFGAGRLCKLIAEVDQLIEESKRDEIFWTHLDRVVIDEIGIQFDREEED